MGMIKECKEWKLFFQGVAQLGSVPVLGTGGRRFKSCHPEWNKEIIAHLVNVL